MIEHEPLGAVNVLLVGHAIVGASADVTIILWVQLAERERDPRDLADRYTL